MNIENDISPEELELIERYCLKQLNEDQLAEFDKRINEDAAFNDKVQELTAVFNGIGQAEKYKLMEGWHSSIKSQPGRLQPGRIIKHRSWMVAAAVLICFVATWLIFFTKTTEERLFTKYYNPDSGLITAMSTTDQFVFDNAMVEYKSGNYREAIVAWQQLLKHRPGSDTLHYFMGSAYLALNELAPATLNLKRVIQLPNSPFIKEAHWYLGLAALQSGNKKEAIENIIKSDHPRKESLLNELRK